jgi:hypothetical protein
LCVVEILSRVVPRRHSEDDLLRSGCHDEDRAAANWEEHGAQQTKALMNKSDREVDDDDGGMKSSQGETCRCVSGLECKNGWRRV